MVAPWRASSVSFLSVAAGISRTAGTISALYRVPPLVTSCLSVQRVVLMNASEM